MVAGLLGLLVGLVGTFVVAFFTDMSSECGGACFSDWVGWVTVCGGVAGAALFGYAAWRILQRSMP